MIDLTLVLASVLALIFGWNNSSFLIGNVRGSGTLSLRGALVVSVIGLLAGVLLEGQKMLKSLDGSLAFSATPTVLLVTLSVSIAVTAILSVLDLPASFSVVMVGAFLGAALGAQLNVNLGQTFLVISFWFIAPILAGLVAYLLGKLLARVASGFSLVGSDTFNRTGVILSCLAVSYSLGANNIGLILGTALGGNGNGSETALAAGFTLIAVVGVVSLGKGSVSGTIGDRLLALSPRGVLSVFASAALLIWVGVQLGVPMSISQCILGGMLGAALSQRIAVINRRLLVESLSSWVLVPLAGFLLALLLVLA